MKVKGYGVFAGFVSAYAENCTYAYEKEVFRVFLPLSVPLFEVALLLPDFTSWECSTISDGESTTTFVRESKEYMIRFRTSWKNV